MHAHPKFSSFWEGFLNLLIQKKKWTDQIGADQLKYLLTVLKEMDHKHSHTNHLNFKWGLDLEIVGFIQTVHFNPPHNLCFFGLHVQKVQRT